MKKIWANFITFNYNIGYLRRGQIFMYFQIKSDLREKNYGNLDILTIKQSLGLGISKKKFLVMNTCLKQVKIINLCVPNNNLLHIIPILRRHS